MTPVETFVAAGLMVAGSLVFYRLLRELLRGYDQWRESREQRKP